MGREIAHVMGHQAADWLERPQREGEAQVKKEMTAHPQLEHAETSRTLPRLHIIIFRKK